LLALLTLWYLHYFCTEIPNAGHVMRTVNAGEAREKLAHLLDAVASGEEIIIVRYGKPVACLTPIFPESVAFPDRSELRTSLPPSNESAGVTFRTLRDDERY
jgi:prevent-host-death family protein